MADNIKLTVSVDGIGKKLNAMLSKAGLARGWLNRVAYPMVINAQRMRWASEGSSEGAGWQALNPTYAAMKLRKYRDAPGGGRKMLIATGRLVAGITGEQQADHYKLVTDTTLMVGTTIGYAKYVNDVRNFDSLGPNTIALLREKLKEYLNA